MVNKSLLFVALVLVQLDFAQEAPGSVLDLTEFEANTPSVGTDNKSRKVNFSDDKNYQDAYFNVVMNGIRMSVPNSGALEDGAENPSAELSELYRWKLP